VTLTTVLACYFLAWLITTSTFPLIAMPRNSFVRRWATWDATDDPDFTLDEAVSLSGQKTNIYMRSLAYLVECTWCTGFWVTLCFYLVSDKIGHVPFDLGTVLATAAGVGVVSTLVSVLGSWERSE
jgi:hypothetical protein